MSLLNKQRNKKHELPIKLHYQETKINNPRYIDNHNSISLSVYRFIAAWTKHLLHKASAITNVDNVKKEVKDETHTDNRKSTKQ